MPGRRLFWLAIALMAAALTIAGCGDDDSDSAEGDGEEAATIEIEGETANYEGTVELTGEPVAFEKDDYYFEPTVLSGDPGQSVQLRITNEGDEEHNLTIADQEIDEDTAPGRTAAVEMKIPDTGVISFFCKFHTAQDMRGALAVTGSEPAPSEPDDDAAESSGGGY